jgi:putative addiction module CopG family antidote
VTISLNPELDRLLNERLASGQYKSVEEVLTRALRALRDEEKTVAAVKEGHEDYLAGRFRSLEEADTEFRQEYGIPKNG